MKKWWTSKTIWFNIVSGAVVIVNELSGKVIPNEAAALVVVVGNTILRVITNQPIK
jgi:hypothetical protein